MSGRAAGALGGELHLDVESLGPDALEPVDLGTPKKTAKDEGGEDEGDDKHKRGDQDEDRGHREGGDDDNDGYSPEVAQRRIRAARRGERKAQRRADRLERQMVNLSVEVEGLQKIASGAMENGAKNRMDEAQRSYNEAFNRRTKAFEEGKADDWNKADADLKRAEADFSSAKAALSEADSKRRAGGPTGVSTSLRDAWIEDNEWFDPNGGDKHSKLAVEISREIAKDGIPANSQAHFDEMDRRLRKRAPELFERGEEGEDEDDEEGTRGNRGRSAVDQDRERNEDRGPRGAMGSQRQSRADGPVDWNKNTKVPKALIENYAAAGYDVNDPKVRDRMMRRYNESASRMFGGSINVG